MMHRRASRHLISESSFLQGCFLQKLYECLTIFMVISILAFLFPSVAKADQSGRVGTVEERKVAYHWYVSSWKRGFAHPICELYVVEDRKPNPQDIYNYCGATVEQEWLTTPICKEAAIGSDPSKCKGLFYWYDGMKEGVVKESILLPEPSVSVETGTCQPGDWCDQRPTLRFLAKEPLENHKIQKINVQIENSVRSCNADACEFRLPITDSNGKVMEYWADSDYGDVSTHQFITFRNVQSSTSNSQYRIDLLNVNWKSYLSPGALIWKVFPDVDDPMAPLLDQVKSTGDLKTDNLLHYLAGRLIYSGKVKSDICPGSGLMSNGMADTCGLEKAHDQMEFFQNQYDQQIYQAALEYNVPARILKGIIAQETQFWPHGYPSKELGFGRMTENGADMLLSWNSKYFSDLCYPYYGNGRCAGGYYNMSSIEKSMLRGMALSKVGSDDEFVLLAATLQGSAFQVNQMMQNITGLDSNYGSTFTDLWKITIANYHAGSGCVGTAMQTAKTQNQPMTWDKISPYLLGDCQGAVNYVDQVLLLSK
jgi:hypothetical protein